ncbi:ribbon-helix-helix domain-containing protein [Aestuariibacter sp. A3R04]|uniref:ribbon-helix-helix domain-containing protein n=1 Tax=Aestuariibacter sp. A3R04 TaxID=2841571 RepID=UPI001C08CAD5|nr:ribbon-helix-helix domain-containing protein [Aestuariibacter sp. A3R04]MBU3021516.1 ribbon-helix-helix domain-containing protein [Aestuariibacter sp. A3R04]
MSLSSLKKSKPSVERVCAVSVDDFIDDAVNYASGQDSVVRTLYPSLKTNGKPHSHGEPMRRATFTLSEESIEQLKSLSAQTGICRSRLIRIWADYYFQGDHTLLFSSTTP